MTPLRIRPYRSSDRLDIERICFETAWYGTSIQTLIDDPRLVTDLWIRYYVEQEPESMRVAEVGGCAVGYLAGSIDPAKHRRWFQVSILPRFLTGLLRQGYWKQSVFWSLMVQAILNLPQGVWLGRWQRCYPAHCHINVDSQWRGQGIGSALLSEFLSDLQRRGIPGVQASTGTEGGKALFLKAGFQKLARYPALRRPGDAAATVWLLAKRIPNSQLPR
jgi:ribosomal protein S18 acetylase RimI-like enzyme